MDYTQLFTISPIPILDTSPQATFDYSTFIPPWQYLQPPQPQAQTQPTLNPFFIFPASTANIFTSGPAGNRRTRDRRGIAPVVNSLKKPKRTVIRITRRRRWYSKADPSSTVEQLTTIPENATAIRFFNHNTPQHTTPTITHRVAQLGKGDNNNSRERTTRTVVEHVATQTLGKGSWHPVCNSNKKV